jgi:hypothetical protein
MYDKVRLVYGTVQKAGNWFFFGSKGSFCLIFIHNKCCDLHISNEKLK